MRKTIAPQIFKNKRLTAINELLEGQVSSIFDSSSFYESFLPEQIESKVKSAYYFIEEEHNGKPERVIDNKSIFEQRKKFLKEKGFTDPKYLLLLLDPGIDRYWTEFTNFLSTGNPVFPDPHSMRLAFKSKINDGKKVTLYRCEPNFTNPRGRYFKE